MYGPPISQFEQCQTVEENLTAADQVTDNKSAINDYRDDFVHLTNRMEKLGDP